MSLSPGWCPLSLPPAPWVAVIVQLLSRVQLCDPTDLSTPGLPVHHSLPGLLKLTSVTLVMPSNHLILCRPLLLLPSIFTSIRVFSNESVLHIWWPEVWNEDSLGR